MKIIKKNIRKNIKRFSTSLIHGKAHKHYPAGAHIAPIYLTTTYDLRDLEYSEKVFSGKTNQDAYTRLSNPNHRELEEKLMIAEGAEAAQVFSSGMGAFTALMISLTRAGDHILGGCPLYGGTFNSLKGFWRTHEARETSFISVNDQYNLAKYLKSNTRLFIFETITNPSIQCWDIPFLVKTIRKYNSSIIIVADNTFATPYNCRPFEFGVDIVWHSLTKYFGEGHHLGGMLLGNKKLFKSIWDCYLNIGSVLDPEAAWDMTEACKTFSLRMEKHNSNALALARFLEKQKGVARVLYPGLKSHLHHNFAKKIFLTPDGKAGFGGMIALELKASPKLMKKFVRYLRDFITFGVSLGTMDTIGNAPFYATHYGLPQKEARLQGVNERLIRISVGCENIKDIVEWFEYALKKTFG